MKTKKEQPTKNESIQHFTLKGVLPEDRTLAIDVEQSVATVMSIEENKPQMLHVAQFTPAEIRILTPLIAAHPHYIPYADLLASYKWGDVEKRERAQKILNDATEIGAWDIEMRPVRNVLSRVRLKTRQIGIEITSILETGYIIMGLFERRRKE